MGKSTTLKWTGQQQVGHLYSPRMVTMQWRLDQLMLMLAHPEVDLNLPKHLHRRCQKSNRAFHHQLQPALRVSQHVYRPAAPKMAVQPIILKHRAPTIASYDASLLTHIKPLITTWTKIASVHKTLCACQPQNINL